MARFVQHSSKCHPQGRHNAVCAIGIGRGYRLLCGPDLCGNGFFSGRREPAYGDSGGGIVSGSDVCRVLCVEGRINKRLTDDNKFVIIKL